MKAFGVGHTRHGQEETREETKGKRNLEKRGTCWMLDNLYFSRESVAGQNILYCIIYIMCFSWGYVHVKCAIFYIIFYLNMNF